MVAPSTILIQIMPKVLLVDDDRDLVDLLRYAFQRDGYTVVTAFDGEAGVRAFKVENPDLVVLDVTMPHRTGIETLKDIRAVSSVPVIMLSALGDEEHVVTALQIGADDYITKPFRPRELMARAQAHLRRGADTPSELAKNLQTLILGDVSLDPAKHQVQVAGVPVQLSRTEFSLLQYLMINANVTVSVANIIVNVWGYEADENDEVVKVTISRLRKKIERDASEPRFIVNVPGVGYRFESR